ncbi:MAG TPA: aldehyde dehydrogenase family protein [Trebonia sp.]
MVNVVTGLSRDTGAALAAHPGVNKVAFTGSTATGRAVAHAAAENINKVTLELGGKSPQVVFADADLAGPATPSPSAEAGRSASRRRADG